MRIRKPLAALAGALFLGGCAFSTPFNGPAVDAAQASDAPVVVSLTLAVLNDDEDARDRFWEYVRIVDATMSDQPGFVGSSKRVEPFGDRAWTMTVWRDEDSLRAFLASSDHRAAVREGMAAIDDALFLRFTSPGTSLPLPWDEAVARLDREGRHFFE